MKYDVIVIGGGIIGTASAFYLKRNHPSLSILLVEQYSRTGMGNTRKSAALYRNFFGSLTSRRLAEASIGFYNQISHSISMDNFGYLWLFSKPNWDKIEKNLTSLEFQQYQLTLLSPLEIQKYFNITVNQINEDSAIYRGILGKNCGALSASSIVKYYTEKFQELGGKIQLSTKISSFHFRNQEEFCPAWKDNPLEYVIDQNGNQYRADSFIFSIGAWSAEFLTRMGIAPGVYPKKRQLFSIKLPDTTFLSSKSYPPALILPEGNIYIKPVQHGKMIVIGGATHFANPFIRTEEDPQADKNYYQKVIRPILIRYFPQFSKLQPFSQWAGYYSYYWPDSNPVIEKVQNISWVSGTSGSGIMKGDSIGRIVAAKVLNFKECTLFNGDSFNVEDLSLKNRKISSEYLVI